MWTSLNLTVSFNNSGELNYSQITINRLNGKNYLEWAQSVRLVFYGKGRLACLISEIKKKSKTINFFICNQIHGANNQETIHVAKDVRGAQ